jgi:hypothetical protein
MSGTAGKSKKGIITGLIILVALIAAFVAVYFLVINPPVSGDKTITVEVIHADKTEKTVDIKTDAEYLRQALEEKDLIQGTESATGLYVLTVDGETVDENNQEWWCFTQNGESLTTGVDTTPIKDGDHFEITFTVGW